MSAPKHTPGPWYVDKAPSIFGGHGFTIHKGSAMICTAFPGASTDRIEPVAELNARLIAAAPELLDALKVMLEQFTKTPSTLKDSECRVKAHAAIAKATGEQA